jgi:hypothetical protein
MKKHWFRIRRYLHLSPKLPCSDKGKYKKTKRYISSYVSNPTNIQKHRFSPLLHYNIVEHRYRKDKKIIIDNGKIGRSYNAKPRPIFYCNHIDTQIFAYYSYKINERLDKVYKSDPLLNNAVIGYRRIDKTKVRRKCTIDFAKETFNAIHNHQTKDLSVLCLDIKEFFDSLSHPIIKSSWHNLFQREYLELDEYKVFKAITNPTYIDLEELFYFHPRLKGKKVKYINNLKTSSIFSSFTEFRSIVYKYRLLKKYNNNDLCKGIPQGTPISATLSNLYFLEVDKEVSSYLHGVGGMYRRYSDDILIMCPTDKLDEVKSKTINVIGDKLKLNIQTKKSLYARLTRDSLIQPWNLEVTLDEDPAHKVISYLGFDYDGESVMIRNKSISKYYRSLKRAIRRRAFYAKLKNESNKENKTLDDAWIYRHRLYKSKSHLGSKTKGFKGLPKKGNYITYIKKADKIFKEDISLIRNKFRRQIRNHWKILNGEITRFEKKYNLPKPPASKNSYTVFKKNYKTE